ncbi:MAG: InlB B-repeat-containing protein, partial [Bacteroidales bacterium]|nr:InlB B-repeat-containing protein [Bacteroidales bacterium]MDD6132387.1 InlB B-repeat-containing protein [Bacteroidales bacterium]MDD6851998.1 InlB B-repeat-containing protein [Bacteroidales bacterium]
NNYLKASVATAAYANTAKWGWLENYIKGVFTAAGSTYSAHYGAGAFFICGQSTSYPVGPSFKEAGKDEAYFPAWGYSYGNPSTVEGEYILHKPYREGAWEFAGWYTTADFSGEPVTTINANSAGTLYAKWNSVREGITYDLNGGSNIINNPYGWKSKADMFRAFMQAALGKTEVKELSVYLADNDPVNAIGGDLYDADGTRVSNGFSDTEKFGWLKTYIMTFQNADKAAGSDATELNETISQSAAAWRFAIAAFFAERKRASWPKSADFTEAGKDEAYFEAWGHSYELINPKFPETDFTLYAAEKVGCTFQGWYDNRWFTGNAVTTVGATTNGTLYAHWSSIMGSENTTLNTLHTHYFDGTYVYASTIDNMGSNKNLYNSDKAGEYFSDKAANFAQEDWVVIKGLTAEDVNKEIAVGTAFTKGDNTTTFPVINITTANAKAASTRELNNYRVANFNIYADNAHVNNIWLVAPQAGEYCHLTGYVKAVSGNVVTLASSDKEDDAVEMTVNIAKLSAKSAVVAGAWYKFTGIVVNGNKVLTFNATSSEDVSTGVEEAEIGSTIVRGMNGEIAVSVAAPATVSVYTAGGALVATRNIADSDAIAVAPGFYIVKADNTVVKVLVK